jgi:hypothetical protein
MSDLRCYFLLHSIAERRLVRPARHWAKCFARPPVRQALIMFKGGLCGRSVSSFSLSLTLGVVSN